MSPNLILRRSPMSKSRFCALALITACAFPALARAAPEGAGPAAVVTRHMAAFAAHDVDALMSDYADDVVTVLPDQVIQGKAAMRGWFVQFFANPGPAFKATLDKVEGDVGSTHWIANQGAPGAVQGYDVFVLRGGKIAFQTTVGVGPVAKPN